MTDKDIPADQNAPHVPAGWPAQPAQPWDVRPVAGSTVTAAPALDERRASDVPWAQPAPGAVPAQAAPQTPPAGASYGSAWTGEDATLVTPAVPSAPPPVPPTAPAGGSGAPPSWFEADLGQVPGPAAPQQKRGPGMIAAAVVGAGALVLGGYAIGHSLGGSGSTQLTSQNQGFGPGSQGQGQQGQQGQQGTGQGGTSQQGQMGAPPGMSGQNGTSSTMVVGQVTAVSGSTLKLTTQSGTATVTVTSSTTVNGTAGGDLSALSTGTLVFVQGTQGSDGTWAATSVSTTPPGMSQNGQSGQAGQGGVQGGPPGQQGTTTQQGTTQQGTQQGAQGTTT